MVTQIILFILLLMIVILSFKSKIEAILERMREKKEEKFKQSTGLDLWKLTEIEAFISFNKIVTIIHSNSKGYFDETNFYIISNNYVSAAYKLKDIKQLTKTNYSTNDNRIWKLTIEGLTQKLELKLIPYTNLTSVNFKLFLDKIDENEDSIVDSEYMF